MGWMDSRQGGDWIRMWAWSSSNRTGGYKETKVAKNGHSGEQIRS